jgi:hypothetical protein
MTETQKAIIAWLANGHTGVSSETMAFWIGFGVRKEDDGYPHDPADFNRCVVLLAAAPGLRRRLNKMKPISKAWARLVTHWAEVEAVLLEEVGVDWSKGKTAPRTYAVMKAVLDGKLPTRAEP